MIIELLHHKKPLFVYFWINNNLIENLYNVYAHDDCTNKWYNENLKQGNYWDDYTGRDLLPPYGIGDSPYDIYYDDKDDNYPLMKPYPNIKSRQSKKITYYMYFDNLPNFFPILQRLLKIIS